MRKFFSCLIILLPALFTSAQEIKQLTVDLIMRDPKWIGTSPSAPSWTADGERLFFRWNPDGAESDSLYYITSSDRKPRKAAYELRQNLVPAIGPSFNTARTACVYEKNGDIFYTDIKSGKTTLITNTVESEANPRFLNDHQQIVFTKNLNLYRFDLAAGTTTQLTNFMRVPETSGSIANEGPQARRRNNTSNAGVSNGDAQSKKLAADQLELFDVLKHRRDLREKSGAWAKTQPPVKTLRLIGIGDKTLIGTTISPDGRFVTYRLYKAPAGQKNTFIPSFVTETGFTTEIPGRTKVGAPQGSSVFYVFDTMRDTIIEVKTDGIPGIRDQPDYKKDYPVKDSSRQETLRGVSINGPSWSPKGTYAIVEVRSQDNKDRWLMQLDPMTGGLRILDRQRDEAWIGGPGIAGTANTNNWINDHTYWFQSEETGYSHLYLMDMLKREKRALTSGNFEVQRVQLSADKKFFYLTTNEVHPGEQHFYRLAVSGGNREKITSMEGAHQVILSPDEKQIAYLYSYTNKPWELYIQPNRTGGKPTMITNMARSAEFSTYSWRDPELVTFKATDGATVYARLYKPSKPHPSAPAVIFVHGAGYLQNAHKWWSSYFREYMFHNLLADNGYTVLDIDYRGSAGYGRDVRTGIYRHMGGKDLDDQVDGARYLIQQHGVNAQHIGIYGGSYGGFMTLMAMFTRPGVFNAGAALRSVTDWAHYNHGYTSNILNEPFTDSLAYRRSSPIYFAEGLKGHLLMCHGMVDVNVHFQDIVRLSQRLIELKKENWELAVYPVEDHGFVEPSSWTDEYKRIFKLFETHLK